jgi:hypothetical protein
MTLGACASRVLAKASRFRGLFSGRLFRRDAETSTRDACAPQKWKSKFRGLFQQLDHTLQQAPRAAAIKAAMIETERNLRLRYWNKF